ENIFEWQSSIRGPADTEFEGGIYHGRIQLPADYPFKPPSFMLLTHNGRKSAFCSYDASQMRSLNYQESRERISVAHTFYSKSLQQAACSDNVDLGAACGKYFCVSCLIIVDPGDSIYGSG
ncbi:unnamed protein product, partial [Eruca vesicaria subsp. sativa]|nr:unnamed protein product [Eruca vesicaria subsp. sativa]